MLDNQVKILHDMMQTIQKNLCNSQRMNDVKPLNPNKFDAATETCSTRENPIFYVLRTKQSLRGWHCYKHNSNK